MVLLMWKWMCLFFRKNPLSRCLHWLSFLNRIGALTLSVLLKKTRKLEPWFVLWSFFLLRLLCISKFAIWPNMQYYHHVWAGAHSCYLEFLDKQQKQICRTNGPSLAASLESLAHCRKVASLSFSIEIMLVDVHLNWLNWFHFFILKGGLLVILTEFYRMLFLASFSCSSMPCSECLALHEINPY